MIINNVFKENSAITDNFQEKSRRNIDLINNRYMNKLTLKET